MTTEQIIRASNNVPNLDAMARDDLMAFWTKHQRGWNAKALFPDGGKGTRKATRKLAAYASNKAAAMLCREMGNVSYALDYERICDRLYEELPAFARSW